MTSSGSRLSTVPFSRWTGSPIRSESPIVSGMKSTSWMIVVASRPPLKCDLSVLDCETYPGARATSVTSSPRSSVSVPRPTVETPPPKTTVSGGLALMRMSCMFDMQPLNMRSRPIATSPARHRIVGRLMVTFPGGLETPKPCPPPSQRRRYDQVRQSPLRSGATNKLHRPSDSTILKAWNGSSSSWLGHRSYGHFRVAVVVFRAASWRSNCANLLRR